MSPLDLARWQFGITTVYHFLSGCTALAPTTDDALEQTKHAIRERIAFLRRHGEDFPDPEPIELVIADHVLDGTWLGFATLFFEPDRQTLSREDLERQVRWLGWSREELIDAAQTQPGGLDADPEGGGRAPRAILEHVASAEQAYVTQLLGSISGANAALKQLASRDADPWPAMAEARRLLVERLLAMTADERALVVQKGQWMRSTRRALRRALEHEWEHTCELRARLGRGGSG